MNFDITIENTASMYYIDEALLHRATETLLAQESIKDALINIILVTDNLIIKLNKTYLQKDETTDVLSFVLEKDTEKGVLEGEVYANLDQIERQAKEYNVTFDNEVARVVIHGLLHLVGYDDQSDEQQKQMTEKEDYYLSLIQKPKGG